MPKAERSISTRSRFYRSTHLELDLARQGALDGYLLTTAARRAIARLAAAKAPSATQRAWTLTGPYGTGKSSFALWATHLLGPSSDLQRNQAVTLLKAEDDRLHQQLFTGDGARTYLRPVVVTGAAEPITAAVLRGVYNTLEGLRGRGVAALKRTVTSLQRNGASGTPVTGGQIINVIDKLLAIAASKNTNGLFLVIDELGKMLEFAAAHPESSDVYILQQLAEHASRSAKPILLLTILHQDFSGYAERLSAAERAEWDKVRGRFEDIAFEEPADDVLRIIARACDTQDRISRGQRGKADATFAALCKEAWNLNLAPPQMQRREFMDLLRSCRPLHPLTALLLGQVFRRVAQNERSAFSFINSDEPYGFQEFLKERQEGEYFGVARLYDYLRHSLAGGLFVQHGGKRWAEIDVAIDRAPEAEAHTVALLKTTGLLNAVGQWRFIGPTHDVLQFALRPTVDTAEVDASLSFLLNKSIVVFRQHSESFALWEGSDVDIAERLSDARDRLAADISTARLIRQYHDVRPIVARRQLLRTGTLRYFEVTYVDAGELQEHINKDVYPADGRLLIVVPDNPQQHAEAASVPKHLSEAQKGSRIIAIVDDARSLNLAARELAAIEWVRGNTPELEGDVTARKELRAREAEVRQQLQIAVESVLNPARGAVRNCTWYYCGKQRRVDSSRDLHTLVADACDAIYPDAAEIHNELLNRRELSSAAAAARNALLAAMVDHRDEDALGIEKFPPEKSMYLSVLRATGIHRPKDGTWQFLAPNKRNCPGLKSVWREIARFFDEAESKHRRVIELFDHLQAPPWGIRAGPLPVLFVSALLASEADVALYDCGAIVPRITSAICERLVKSPEQFSVRRCRVAGVRVTVFQEMARLLGKTDLFDMPGQRNVLDVVRPLLRFYSALPEYTRNTSDISERAKAVRAAFVEATEPDQLLFADLPAACECAPFAAEAADDPATVKEYLKRLRSALGELQRAYDVLIEQVGEAIGTAFGVEGTIAVIRPLLRERAGTTRPWVADRSLLAFVNRVMDDALDDVPWIESVAGLLAERPLQMWRDEHRARFEVELRRMTRLFTHVEAIAFAPDAPTGPDNGHVAVRLGVTRHDEPEVERVLHLDRTAVKRATDLERRLREVLDTAGVNGDPRVALAAMANVARTLLVDTKATGKDD